MGHGAAARDRILFAPLWSWTGPVVVGGRLIDDAATIDGVARVFVEVNSIEDGRETYPVRGRIQAYVSGELAAGSVRDWKAGRWIRAPVTLRRPQVWLNPGGPSERWQVLRRQFLLTGTIKSALLVQVRPAPVWDEWAAAVRAEVRERVARIFPDPADPTGAVVVAILIGDRSWLEHPIERRLQVAGTYHVIAISGGNVALLTAGIYLCLRLLVRSARLISVLTMVSVISYGWIVGGEPSVARAVTVACVYLAVGLAGVVPPALNVLALVAVIVTLADPMTMVDAGAWLSFGATFGIIAGAGRLVAWHDSRWPGPALATRVRRWLLGLCGATLAAEVTLLPVAASLFNRVGVAGLALNVVAVPMIAVVQVAGLVGALLAGVWDMGASAAATIARLATGALLGSSALVDAAPWLSWRVPSPSGGVIVAFYLSGLLWITVSRSTARRCGGMAFGLAALLVACNPATTWRQPRDGWLRLTMMDVGQGDATLVQFPTGQSLLIDAGGAGTRFDAGERVVSPALWASGVRRLDWLAISHADLDHIGGAAAVSTTFGPREVWEGVPVPGERTRRRLIEVSPAWRQLQAHDRFRVGDVTLEVLHPLLPDWERQRVRNEDSLVLRLRYQDVDILLTGDIGVETERVLPLDDHRAPIRILKVAHHGSRSSSSDAFLERYAPHVALISAGRGNPFGHPAPDVVARLQAVGARVFRSDRDGATVIETDGRALTVHSMRGRAWTMRVWRTAA
jgi:competence protein ComEC